MVSEQNVAEILLEIKAVTLSPDDPFTWASGMKSPIYCDNRLTLSYPDIRDKIKIALLSKCKNFEPFDLVAGVATAGIPQAALLADALHLPLVYVRSKSKGHGRRNQIEGNIGSCKKVLVIEDLISTGGSSIEAVKVLRDAGLEVQGVLAIFQYGLPSAKANFRHADCDYLSLTDYETLIGIALQRGDITQEQAATLSSWNRSPEDWYERVHQL